MKIRVICNYCNNEWTQYGTKLIEDLYCTKCEETKDLRIMQNLSESVDYYIGCPPFDPKPLTLRDFPDFDRDEDSQENFFDAPLLSNTEDQEDLT